MRARPRTTTLSPDAAQAMAAELVASSRVRRGDATMTAPPVPPVDAPPADAPPADTPIGVNALVYLVIGYVTGFIIDPRDRTVPLLMGIVGLSAGAATLAVAAIDSVIRARIVIGRAAARHGLRISFSPVPFDGAAGNGAHLADHAWWRVGHGAAANIEFAFQARGDALALKSEIVAQIKGDGHVGR